MNRDGNPSSNWFTTLFLHLSWLWCFWIAWKLPSRNDTLQLPRGTLHQNPPPVRDDLQSRCGKRCSLQSEMGFETFFLWQGGLVLYDVMWYYMIVICKICAFWHGFSEHLTRSKIFQNGCLDVARRSNFDVHIHGRSLGCRRCLPKWLWVDMTNFLLLFGNDIVGRHSKWKVFILGSVVPHEFLGQKFDSNSRKRSEIIPVTARYLVSWIQMMVVQNKF